MLAGRFVRLVERRRETRPRLASQQYRGRPAHAGGRLAGGRARPARRNAARLGGMAHIDRKLGCCPLKAGRLKRRWVPDLAMETMLDLGQAARSHRVPERHRPHAGACNIRPGPHPPHRRQRSVGSAAGQGSEIRVLHQPGTQQDHRGLAGPGPSTGTRAGRPSVSATPSSPAIWGPSRCRPISAPFIAGSTRLPASSELPANSLGPTSVPCCRASRACEETA
jgi:hypothetical protein